MTAQFIFYPRNDAACATFEAIARAIPGVWWKNGVLRAPDNAAWKVEQLLRSANTSYGGSVPEKVLLHTKKLEKLPPIPELRDFVLGGDGREPFLLPYQIDALRFCIPRSGSLCVHPTGSGKTLTAICWTLAKRGLGVLICRSTTVRQFVREVKRYTQIEPLTIVGEKALTEEEFEVLKKARIVIVGWGVLTAHVDELIKAKPQSIVFDESHKAKQHKRSKRVAIADKEETEATLVKLLDGAGEAGADQVEPTPAGEADEVKDEAASAPAPWDLPAPPKYKYEPLENVSASARKLSAAACRRLGTTATPIKNVLCDLWAQLDLLEPWCWGTFSQWAIRYANATPGAYGGLETKGTGSKEALEELRARMSFMTHGIPASVTHHDLPPLRRMVQYLPAEELVKDSGGFRSELKKARKASGVNGEFEVRLAQAASMKRRWIVDRIKEAVRENQKVVVFTGRQRDCDFLFESVSKAVDGKVVPLFNAHGGNVTDKQRDEIQLAYTANEGAAVLIGTRDLWGESTDGLQCTDLAVMAMLPFTPGEVQQNEGRFRRRGMKRPVLAVYPVCEGTVEEHVADILLNKLPAVERVIGDVGLDGFSKELATGGKTDDELDASLIEKILGSVKELP